MRFLADESCDFAVVRALREAGHDVLAIREVSPRAEDSAVVDRAHREERLLLGQLVYAGGLASSGVVYLRFPATARKRLAEAVLELVQEKGVQLNGRFVVMQPGRTRIGPARTD